jgi:hypothetical protein
MLDEVNNRAEAGAPAVDSGIVIKLQFFVKFVFFHVRYQRSSLGTIKDKASRPKQTNKYA